MSINYKQPRHIKELSKNLINVIAAGEVIERPASVLKELIENAIDADAKRIFVEVKNSACSLIRVIDDGYGIYPEDLKLALDRHTTSKIFSYRELAWLSTMGFRGEALPSIATVSYLILRSRPQGYDVGNEIYAVGGSVRQIKQVACSKGTFVEVRDLFYNTPVRKKFLKSQNIETGYLRQVIFRLALSRPDIGFHYTHGGRILYKLPPVDLVTRIESLLGAEIFSHMVEINYTSSFINIKGFTSLPDLTRLTYDKLYTFVNNRYVRNKTLLNAIAEAYKGVISSNRRPVSVLYLNLSPDQIDVNVHPTKEEVKFYCDEEVQQAVIESLRQGFSKPHKKKTIFNSLSSKSLYLSKTRFHIKEIKQLYNSSEIMSNSNFETEKKEYSLPKLIPLFNFTNQLRVIGQLSEVYILCSSHSDDLVIVDQHAAHERLTYQSLKLQLNSGNISRQWLLNPTLLNLTPEEAIWIQQQQENWKKLGVELVPFSGFSWSIISLPVILGDYEPEALVRGLLSELSATRILSSTPDFIEICLRTMACRSSIKKGKRLSREEMQDLISRISVLTPPITCPHGRPVLLTISSSELERYFKRGKKNR